jgi:hypothetical protein
LALYLARVYGLFQSLYAFFCAGFLAPFFVIYLRPSLWFRRGLFRVRLSSVHSPFAALYGLFLGFFWLCLALWFVDFTWPFMVVPPFLASIAVAAISCGWVLSVLATHGFGEVDGSALPWVPGKWWLVTSIPVAAGLMWVHRPPIYRDFTTSETSHYHFQLFRDLHLGQRNHSIQLTLRCPATPWSWPKPSL